MPILFWKRILSRLQSYKLDQIINYKIMETNYFIIVIALVIVLIVIILLILKNKKDLKEFESKLNNQDIDPEHHKGEKV